MAASAMKTKSSVVASVSLVVLISVLATNSAIAAPGDAVWVDTFDGAAGLQDRGVDIEMSPDGSRVFVTGTTVVTGRRRDYVTLAYDGTTGAKLWEATLGRSHHDWARSIAVSPDGVSVFVTGITTDVEGVHSWTTVAYDAAIGTRLWTSRYDSPHVSPLTFGAGAQPTAVFAAGGSVYVVGNLEIPSATLPRFPALVIAYEASDGSQRWLRRYAFHRYEGAQAGAIVRSAAMAPAGESMYLAIQVDETPTQNSAGVLAIDTENGDRRWRSNYIDPQGAEGAHADSIAVSPDGQHVYVGMSFNLVPRLLLAFGSTDGQLLWEGDLSASLFGRVADLAVSADGGKVFGTGNLGFNLWTWAIDAENGNVLWEHEFHRQRGDSAQAAAAVAVSGGGHVVVTGQSSRIVCQVMDCTQASDIITIAYDAATGLRLWRALLGDRSVDAPDVGKDVVVHPDGGSALVSGWTTQSGSSSDIVAIAYEL